MAPWQGPPRLLPPRSLRGDPGRAWRPSSPGDKVQGQRGDQAGLHHRAARLQDGGARRVVLKVRNVWILWECWCFFFIKKRIVSEWYSVQTEKWF